MKRIRYNCAFVLLVLLQGCAALGLPVAQTFNEKVAAAYTTVSTVRGTAAGLVSAGKISPDDAQNVQNQCDHARAAIEIARQLHATNPSGGDTKLASATLILNALNDYLKGRS
jgi:hypothetical protein